MCERPTPAVIEVTPRMGYQVDEQLFPLLIEQLTLGGGIGVSNC